MAAMCSEPEGLRACGEVLTFRSSFFFLLSPSVEGSQRTQEFYDICQLVVNAPSPTQGGAR